MFIPTLNTTMPGLEAELLVWNSITNAFEEKRTLAIHHFPMFFSQRSGRREIDMLIINDSLGVCVIEVKSLNINQIKEIRAHEWIYSNFYEDKGFPYKQAENQLYMICEYLSKDPLLYGRLNKSAVVALPYISESDWKSRGFDKRLDVSRPIFKEDLQDKNRLIKKLESYSLKKATKKLSDNELSRISRLLNIELSSENKPKLASSAAFSYLYVIQSNENFRVQENKIINQLQAGSKVYILTFNPLKISKDVNYDQYIKKFQLNIYEAAADKEEFLEVHCFKNGESITEDFLDILSEKFPKFNKGQFKAIHLPVDTNQIITAGAGTGKTHVMIDRIIFLLMSGHVSLKQIIMITFTNASTNEMKKRLEEKFLDLFKLTNKNEFLNFAEEVRDVQISTIHSFSYSILKTLAHEMGYGRDIRLKSYVYEKKKIIRKLLDEFYKGEAAEFFLKTEIRDYEFIDLVFDMWEEMDRKGLNAEEITKIDWGSALNKESQHLQECLHYIFEHCEVHLDKLKLTDNAVTMGDLLRKLKKFSSNEIIMKQLLENKFMFVDEFQDSDNVQIELLSSLHRFLNYKLFVVGDVKQAIYRFRGADYRSFQELEESTKDTQYVQTELQLNYRTSKSLLQHMHFVFEKWNQKGWLTYRKSDQLLSNKPTDFSQTNWNISFDYKEDLTKALQTLPKKEDKIALIVRTNKQAKRLKEHCRAHNILTTENLDGTFFTSLAVLHFKALIEGLLYVNEPKFLIGALETPYFGFSIPYQTLIPFNGQKNQINKFIHTNTHNQLKEYARCLRTLTPMTVIQNIIFNNQLFLRLPKYFEEKLKESKRDDTTTILKEVDVETMRYTKNLQHLMLLIEKQFSSQTVTLRSVHSWLQLQVSTNRSENEPLIDQQVAQVEITTVHRSKGLEYHTVFLPITDSSFDAVEQKYVLEESSEETRIRSARKFGWKINDKGIPNSFGNDYFLELKKYEDREQLKEEARLLYVALTRAKERVFITLPKTIKKNTWAYILRDGGINK
ncbi:exodeoxyribonuclease V subunit beta [Saccharibacillus sp. O23]|uniref:UvrD-helicase domain-containing protein n=1 Tax=Saccharibacillus sp. O23 TaxID=2009338 RepID=UPI0015C675A3|nr:ATP-dependent helicase [Saccharibacillus sp. O23]